MSEKTPLLFLYDIDGTLLSTGGSGYRSFVRSCREVLDISGPLDGVGMAGKLDRVIFREIASAYRPDLEGTDLGGLWNEFRERYVRYLEEESRTPDDWRLFPGVRELVEHTAELGYHALLTGNVREGAMIKLSVLGLDSQFPTGGFGETDITRSQLAEQAYDEACRHYDILFERGNTFVLGDTANDVKAAADMGARSIAVATGTVSAADLERAGADMLVEDFGTGLEEVLEFITGQ